MNHHYANNAFALLALISLIQNLACSSVNDNFVVRDSLGNCVNLNRSDYSIRLSLKNRVGRQDNAGKMPPIINVVLNSLPVGRGVKWHCKSKHVDILIPNVNLVYLMRREMLRGSNLIVRCATKY